MSISRKKLQDRLARKESQLELANETLEKLLAEDIESYKFDSGDGSQQARRRKISELREEISTLESEIDSLCRRLSRKGLTNVSLSRRPGCGLRR